MSPKITGNGTIGGGTLADWFSVFVLAAITLVGTVWGITAAILVLDGRIVIDYTIAGTIDVGLLDDLGYLLIGLAFMEVYGKHKFMTLLNRWQGREGDGRGGNE